ncbi:hypothetical protein CERSUDRAFT_116769 [Gelatoporia subvermispora B]|uniref:F-box domain-containing protein n=1 Tax=Ceriporiopsis subvermispora (strain B) TaxID=914234 RepID=M2PFA5_CERS8|nr:hypothetical protein CERSUDRAFT_116769 [Gelatoporia subvermispora B]
MKPDKIPADVWMEVFGHINHPQTLLNVSLASKAFCDFAFRALHRHLIWRKPQDAVASISVFGNNPGLQIYVRTLCVGVSTLPEPLGGFIVDENGEIAQRAPGDIAGIDHTRLNNSLRYYSSEPSPLFASRALHDSMINRIAGFASLANLTFFNVIFTHQHFTLFHSLPRLRKLHLEFCIFPLRSRSPSLDHSTLSLTELTMLNLRRRLIDWNDGHHVTVEEDVTHILTLATAHNLRTLRVDSTADVFRHVFRANTWDDRTPEYTIPVHLERLYVQRKQLFPGKVQPMFPGEGSFPDGYCYHFLWRARSLQTLSLCAHSDLSRAPPQDALPNLRQYAGQIDSALPMAKGRRVEAFSLTFAPDVRQGLTTLASLGRHFPDLKMLSLVMKEWEPEVIYIVSHQFTKLRKLRIVYDIGGPNEDLVVSFGPDYFLLMPELHTVQIFSTPADHSTRAAHPKHLFDPTFNSVEEELQNLVIPWNRFCSSLREVQLMAGYVMNRGFEGDKWKMTRVDKYDTAEDFQY